MRGTFAVGDQLTDFVVESVDPGRMKTMSVIMRDPNPIHWNVNEVRRLGMGDKPINQGPVSVAYILNMLIAASGGPEHVRRLKVRCLGNVFAEERVRAGGTVTALKESGAGLLVECAVWLDKSDGSRVLDGEAAFIRAS
jgi:acyl dehydratase